MGIVATDNHAQITGTSTLRISGGKTVEELVDYGALGFWQQLGTIPPLGQAKGRAVAGQD